MAIERVILSVAGLVGLFQIWRGLRTGAASEDGRIRRDDRPILYWLLLAAAASIVGVVFYFAVW